MLEVSMCSTSKLQLMQQLMASKAQPMQPLATDTTVGKPSGILTGKITVSTYVDYPIIVCDNIEVEQWFHQMMEDQFDVKFHNFLTPEAPLDYCGARITLTVDGQLKVDNNQFIENMLHERGLQDCNSAKNPLIKGTMTKLHANSESKLNAEEATPFRSGLGQIDWLAGTTHPKLTTAHSVLARYTANLVEGCLEALKTMVRFVAGCMDECLVATSTVTEGLKVYSDSEWAGQFSDNGEAASRSGCLIA